MKRSGIVAVTSVGVSVLAVGCGSSSHVSTAPAQTSSTATTPPTSSAPSDRKAGVGDTIELSDSTTGKNIAVTVTKVVDPDAPSNPYETPPAGDRFESIQFRIVNSGTGPYQDAPLAEISAKDAAGQTMQLEIVTATAAGAQMPASVNLAPGDTALGFVTFAVPAGDKIAQTQFTIIGAQSATGEWQIGNGQPPATSPPTAGATPTPAAPTTPAAPPPPTTSASSPQTVVQQYFAAINAHDYALAWALGGKNLQGGSYDSFVQGFATTSSDNVTIIATSGDVVTIQLDATQTDGTHKFFAGTYTVKNGVIVAADIH
ncbi:DUF4352 domain-containing protein [Catenulispora subtropica]|uniref:DUF4352 domain-containing protein n=1 Tax=Catenulispora subtropica TaxID=450798 RepID=A0ABN2SGH8_9ACTN